MQRLLQSLVILVLVSSNAMAMVEQKCEVVTREGWGAQVGIHVQLDKHQGAVEKIIVGHTVTDKGDSILTLQAIQKSQMASGFADICYNDCLDDQGICYECRDHTIQPGILRGHNIKTCAVGLIGRYDMHEEARKISGDVAEKWGKQFGRIAFDLGFKKLVRGENIFGMSELEPERFPLSPGKQFMDKFDYIIQVANEKLESLSHK